MARFARQDAMRIDAGDGRRLACLRRGEGPPVVCVPGGPGFDPAAYCAALSLPGYEQIVLVPRGTGDSTPPPTTDGYRLSGYVDELEALRVALGVEMMTVLGHSHGGSVALAYAIDDPGRVTRLVLVGAPPGMDERFRRELAVARARFARAIPDGSERLATSDAAGAALPDATSDAQRRELPCTALSRHVARLDDVTSAYLRGICSAPLNRDAAGVMFTEMSSGLDLISPAAQVDLPALLVSGEHDVVVPPKVTRALARAMPRGEYLELPGAGHFADVERPDAFTEAVLAFLGDGD